MGLETGNYLDDLVITNPVGASDAKQYGDDHLRLIKKTLKQTLPGMTGRFNRVTTKSSTYTVVANDNTTVFSTTGTWTLDLTAAATIGNGFVVAVYNGGAGVITVDPNAAETVNGLATEDIAAGRMAYLYCDGSNWKMTQHLITDNYAVKTEVNDFDDILTFQKGIGPMHIQNLRFTAAVAANALTFAIKTKAGTDPAAGDIVDLAFRSSTLTETAYNIRQLSAALSITVPAGATLGFGSSETGYIALYAIDNAGTVELAVAGSVRDQSLYQPETGLISTTVLDTASDSSCKLYSTVARSNVPCRFLGFIKVQTDATAGNWVNAPTELSLVANIKRFGSKRVLFTSSGTFYVPLGVTELYVEAVGSGGGGGGGAGSFAGAEPSSGGGGGGGPGHRTRDLLSVTPGDAIAVTVGAGGAGGVGGAAGGGTGATGTSGGDTTFSTLTAKGGTGGTGGAHDSEYGVPGLGGEGGKAHGAATAQAAAYQGWQARGGDGENGSTINSTYGGGGGAGGSGFQDPAGNGGARQTTVSTAGNAGGDATGIGSGGGGGSGARYGAYAGGAGGAGSDGAVLVEW